MICKGRFNSACACLLHFQFVSYSALQQQPQSTRSYTDFLVDSILKNREDGKAFFAYLAFSAPHDPLHVPEPRLGKYRGNHDDGCEALKARRATAAKQKGLIPDRAAMPERYHPERYEWVTAWDSLTREQLALESWAVEVYAGMVNNMDYHFGRGVDFLKDIGEHDNTIVIFLVRPARAGFAAYRLPDFMIRLGVHDANADVQESGFDTYEKGELFRILDVGYDTSQIPRKIDRPPQSTIHVSLWYQDDHGEAGIDDCRGIGVSVVQRLGRFIPFLRYGYADVDARGPTSARHMTNVGLVIDNIFGQDNDCIGVGYTWADPADRALDNQSEIDAYYRV